MVDMSLYLVHPLGILIVSFVLTHKTHISLVNRFHSALVKGLFSVLGLDCFLDLVGHLLYPHPLLTSQLSLMGQLLCQVLTGSFQFRVGFVEDLLIFQYFFELFFNPEYFFFEKLYLVFFGFDFLPHFPGPIAQNFFFLLQICDPVLLLSQFLLPAFQCILFNEQILAFLLDLSHDGRQLVFEIFFLLEHHLILRHVSDYLVRKKSALSLEGFDVGNVFD